MSKPNMRIVHQESGRTPGVYHVGDAFYRVAYDDPGGPVEEVFGRRADLRSRAERALDRLTRADALPSVRVEV